MEQMMSTFYYKRPRRRRTPLLNLGRAAIVAAAILFIGAATAVFLLSSSITSAAEGPKGVDGIVRDSFGDVVVGADVTVNIRNKPSGQVTASLQYVTITGGFYTVSFAKEQWQIGDTIEVLASYGDESGTNSVVADEEPYQEVNVNMLPIVIPEFPGFYLSVVVSLIAILLVRMGGSRRPKSNL